MCITFLDNETLATKAKADAQKRATRFERYGDLGRGEILRLRLRGLLVNLRGNRREWLGR